MNRILPLLKTTSLVLLAGLLFSLPAQAQKFLEKLNRGVVAVRTSSSQVYVGWRLFGTDPAGIAFNVYRGSVKANATPVTNSTNFVDNTTVTNALYSVRPVLNGVEQAASATAPTRAQQFLSIPLQIPAGGTTPSGEAYTYSANDCSTADLDGDGEYEFVVKWDPSNAKDNSQSGYTGNVYLDAYKLNGTRLWRIDLGRNIRAGAHYTQLMVYDLDSDGKAEVACKTADATVDGVGTVIGSATADYRNAAGYILSGPEFLTVFNGQTGAAMATTRFLPQRDPIVGDNPTPAQLNTGWGDNYGNRVDRFISAIAYLDGQRPSLVMGRGYYTRLVRVAWDWRNGQLSTRWIFDSKTAGNSAYAGMGNHQLTVGDVDGDGKDEVCNGASTIDDDGTGLYANGLGHGDALHMGDLDPNRPGQEVWQCHEEPARYGQYGLEFRDARTGVPIWGVPGGGADVGRAQASDIDPAYPGAEVWGSVGGLYSCTGVQISTAKPATVNFGLWWDGDLQRELLDGDHIDKWNPATGTMNRQLTIYAAPYNMGYNNSTKRNPGLSADVLGDWREEVISRTNDNLFLVVLTTTIPTTYRLPTLMHDAQYRTQVALQNSAYNQPPHPSYYLGGGMNPPPVANIALINANSTPLGSGVTNLAPANGAANVPAASTALTWQGAASRYNVFVGTSPQTLQLVTAGTTQTSYTLAAPTASSTYYWRVDALYDGDAIRDGETIDGSVWSFTVAPVTATTWTGTLDTDWTNAANWTAGVPTTALDALISAGAPRYPVLTAGTANAKNLTIGTDASLTQTGGVLAMSGDFTQQGNYTATGASTLMLSGTAPQSLNASTLARFMNLTVGSAGVTLNGPVAVSQVLTLNGNLATNGSDFTLLSSSAGDALVVNNGGVVTGTATVQRYIDPSLNPGRGYRHFSAPVSNTTVADLATSGFVPEISQANTYNASATPGSITPFPTVFGYDQSRVSLTNSYAPFDRGFVVPSNSNTSLTVGRGYAVNLSAAALVDFAGTLNTGTQSLTLTRNAAGSANAADAGWHLLGNPYPSPLSFADVAPADMPGLDAAMYVFESSSPYAGTYRSYVNGIPAANAVISQAQGFFVRVSSGQTSGTFTFRDAQRVTTYGTQVPFRRGASDPRPLVQLELRGAAGPADAFYAYAEPGATTGFDAPYDARKLPNTTGLNLASTASTGESLTIDGRSVFSAATVFPLTVGVPAAGTYTLTAAALNNLPTGLDAYLDDAQTGQRVNLRQQDSYSFSVNPVQALALVTGRFTLRFAAASPLATAAGLTAGEVTLYPNPAHAQFTVLLPAVAGAAQVHGTLLNVLGQVVRQQSVAMAATGARLSMETVGLASGVYTLRLQVGATMLVKRVVLQ